MLVAVYGVATVNMTLFDATLNVTVTLSSNAALALEGSAFDTKPRLAATFMTSHGHTTIRTNKTILRILG